MATIKWTKDDVIAKFQEAVTAQPTSDKQADRHGILKTVIEKAKTKRSGV